MCMNEKLSPRLGLCMCEVCRYCNTGTYCMQLGCISAPSILASILAKAALMSLSSIRLHRDTPRSVENFARQPGHGRYDMRAVGQLSPYFTLTSEPQLIRLHVQFTLTQHRCSRAS